MADNFFQRWRSLRVGALVAVAVGLFGTLLVWSQVVREQAIDVDDIDRRARAVAHVLSYTVHDALRGQPENVAARLGRRLEGHSRLLGCAVFGPDERLLAAGQKIKGMEPAIAGELSRLAPGESDVCSTLHDEGLPVRIRVEKVLRDDGEAIGTFVVAHDVTFVEERAAARLTQGLFVVSITAIVLAMLIVVVMWLAYDRPLQHLADWMQRLRIEDSSESPPVSLPSSRLVSESHRLAASYRAARTATIQDAHEAARSDRVWTSGRLRTHAIDCLGVGNQLVVVSSREPYLHVRRD